MSLHFDWLSKDVCEGYAENWEISLDEVHYGWLAPGEKTLGLLGDVPPGSAVLDVGCGMGENMAALHAMKADPYGIDISAHMLRRARANLRRRGVATGRSDLNERLRECDMRDLAGQFNRRFRAAISAYSLEFLPDVDAFDRTVESVSDLLEDGGTFVFCVSHPTSHPHYPRITNESLPTEGEVRTLMYSVRDAVHALCSAGFAVERIVEQKTCNPSRMTYAQAREFPYHFREGKNPFHPLFDAVSNGNPHTMVYKARKTV